MATDPELLIEATPEAVARRAADLVPGLLGDRDEPVLGVATGVTPRPLYELLAREWTPPPGLHLVLLDEYAGIPPDDPRSFRAEITRGLAEPLGVPTGRLHGPDTASDDTAALTAAAARYEERLAALGGVDLQLLGIGSNGHLAFCEPGTPLESRTHVATLARSTRVDAGSSFGALDQVPRRAVTQGLATILAARRVLLLATGARKATALAAALAGPVTPEVPASAIRLHPRAIVLADGAAAGALP